MPVFDLENCAWGMTRRLTTISSAVFSARMPAYTTTFTAPPFGLKCTFSGMILSLKLQKAYSVIQLAEVKTQVADIRDPPQYDSWPPIKTANLTYSKNLVLGAGDPFAILPFEGIKLSKSTSSEPEFWWINANNKISKSVFIVEI